MKRCDCRAADAYLKVTLIAAVSLSAGCRSVVPVNVPVEPGSGIVEIRLASPRTIEARRPDGSPVTLQELTMARGRMTEVRGDSIVFQIESWRSARAPAEHSEQPSVAATFGASDSAIRAYERRVSASKTLLALGIVVGLVALAIGQAAIA